MRAVTVLAGVNKPILGLIERPVPKLSQIEVLVKVAAAGVNRPDLLQRQGDYPPPPGTSDILGLEIAGVVADIGSGVTDINVGDRVCALVSGGGYAEYCPADIGCCLPVPECFSYVQAAALPETFFTVWSNVFDRARLMPGETILVHGGGSGIGTVAIQLAKAFGSTVFVTAGGGGKCRRCLELGADAAIDYRRQDFIGTVKELTNGKGVDIILDMVGGEYFPLNLKCLAEDGRLIQIAVQNGAISRINLWSMMVKRQTISGSTLRGRDRSFKSAIARSLQEKVWPILESGHIYPVIDSVFQLAEAERAHNRMLGSQHFGKIILET